MKYEIEYYDGLYCIYRCERLGMRIICACDTLKEAKEVVERLKGERE